MPWLSEPVAPEVLSAVLDDVPERRMPAETYWARLQPHLGCFGISRVADITGLDRIGFPVAQAVRPLARSNAVTQGKAASLEGAAVGAVLECLEMAVGETPERLKPASSGDAALWSAVAPGVAWPTAQTEYVAAWDIVRDAPAAVPRDLMCTDFSRGAKSGQAPILRSSIGLGAAGTLGAAMMHGLLECIEADARIRAEASGRLHRISLDAGNPEYSPLLARIRRAALRVAAWDMSGEAWPFAVMASVMEAPGARALPLPATGYAARHDLDEAIAAALAEAVQARLAVISGAREDITQRFYDHGVDRQALEAEWTRHGPAPSLPVSTGGGTDAPRTLRALAARVGPVFAVPLHWDPGLPLAITRVLAPRLVADPLRVVPTG